MRLFECNISQIFGPLKYLWSIGIIIVVFFACSRYEEKNPNDPETAGFFLNTKSITVEFFIDQVTWVYYDLNFNNLGSDTSAFNLNFTTLDEGSHTIGNSRYFSTFDKKYSGKHLTGSMTVWSELDTSGIPVIAVFAEKIITDNNIEIFSLNTREIPMVSKDTSGLNESYTFELRGEQVCNGYLFTAWYELRSNTHIKTPANIDPFSCLTDESRCVVKVIKTK